MVYSWPSVIHVPRLQIYMGRRAAYTPAFLALSSQSAFYGKLQVDGVVLVVGYHGHDHLPISLHVKG